MTFKVKDHFFHKAKEEGFAARSVYKLQEIDKKNKILKPGQTIIDLGAAPGSWSQWASQKVGPQGYVIGFDLTEITIKLQNAHFFQADLLTTNIPEFLEAQNLPSQADLVISDMAPKTTGIRSVDQARSAELCEMALMVANQVLKKDGHFVCKFFQGEDFNSFRDKVRKQFRKIDIVKPESTRSRSFEIFIVGIKKKA